MRVTRLTSIFSTILSLSAMTGREENLEDGNDDEYEELHDAVGDGGDAIFRSLRKPPPTPPLRFCTFPSSARITAFAFAFCFLSPFFISRK